MYLLDRHGYELRHPESWGAVAIAENGLGDPKRAATIYEKLRERELDGRMQVFETPIHADYALIQAERYGTPVGQALRVMAKENREMRITEAEKKAAALPAKLTVPMIVFFLPVLFLVILGPAFIKIDAMGLGKPAGTSTESVKHDNKNTHNTEKK